MFNAWQPLCCAFHFVFVFRQNLFSFYFQHFLFGSVECGRIHSELVYEFCKIMCDRWEGGSEDEHNGDFLGFCNLEAAPAAGIWAS